MVAIHEPIHHVLSLLNRGMEQRMLQAGLSGVHWQPMLHLLLSPGTTVAELARKCGRKPSSMTRVVDQLETMDLCRRTRSNQDRRLVSVALTQAGTAKAVLIPAILDSVESFATAGFTNADFEQFASSLKNILANFDSVRGCLSDGAASG